MTREQVIELATAFAVILAFIIVLMFLGGFAFEAVKWLGHTQK